MFSINYKNYVPWHSIWSVGVQMCLQVIIVLFQVLYKIWLLQKGLAFFGVVFKLDHILIFNHAHWTMIGHWLPMCIHSWFLWIYDKLNKFPKYWKIWTGSTRLFGYFHRCPIIVLGAKNYVVCTFQISISTALLLNMVFLPEKVITKLLQGTFSILLHNFESIKFMVKV